jgi:hypothetical protein
MVDPIEYFKERGIILPGSQGKVAEWIAENNGE